MSFDGLAMAAVVSELKQGWLGARIEKIYQPLAKEITLMLHKDRQKMRLLMSADAQKARVHLSSAARENPIAPPLFCMVLRKHLEGGRITGFHQQGLERVMEIRIEAVDELGMLAEKSLLCEVMGKHSNIILVDPASNVIIDGISRYSYATSRHREVLPGRQYAAPPAPEGINPLEAAAEKICEALWEPDLEIPLEKLIVKKLAGFGPQTSREIIIRAGLRPDMSSQALGERELNLLSQTVRKVAELVRTASFEPTLYFVGSHPAAFAPINLTHAAEPGRRVSSMNEALNEFYAALDKESALRQKSDRLRKVVGNEVKKLEKKAALHQDSLRKAADAEKLKIHGELITANIYMIPAKTGKIEVVNYYDPEGSLIEIELDPHRSPAENAQSYFKRYSKAKSAGSVAKTYLQAANEELSYLASVLTAIDQAEQIQDLAEIEAELTREGYLKPEKLPKKGKEPAVAAPEPLSLPSIGGFQILVGRNNRQNDYLTMKLARPEDMWLHAKDIPGSHVIIRNPESREIPAPVLQQAAEMAAYYSQARESGKVPVDYALRKHVRKPKGARPGMVIYDHQQTVLVAPKTSS